MVEYSITSAFSNGWFSVFAFPLASSMTNSQQARENWKVIGSVLTGGKIIENARGSVDSWASTEKKEGQKLEYTANHGQIRNLGIQSLENKRMGKVEIDIMTAWSHNIKCPAALDCWCRKLRRFIAGKWKQIVCSVKECYNRSWEFF